jgi:hypothetical protein
MLLKLSFLSLAFSICFSNAAPGQGDCQFSACALDDESSHLAMTGEHIYNHLDEADAGGTSQQVDYISILTGDLLYNPRISTNPRCTLRIAKSYLGPRLQSRKLLRFDFKMLGIPHLQMYLHNRVINGADLGYNAFRLWLKQKILQTPIVPLQTLFADISSRIAMKDGFVTETSSRTGWDVYLTERNGSTLFFTWKLVYRASLFGFGADNLWVW